MTKPLSLLPPDQVEAIRAVRRAYYIAHREVMLQQSKDAQKRRYMTDAKFRREKKGYYRIRQRRIDKKVYGIIEPLLASGKSWLMVMRHLNNNQIYDYSNRPWTVTKLKNVLDRIQRHQFRFRREKI